MYPFQGTVLKIFIVGMGLGIMAACCFLPFTFATEDFIRNAWNLFFFHECMCLFIHIHSGSSPSHWPNSNQTHRLQHLLEVFSPLCLGLPRSGAQIQGGIQKFWDQSCVTIGPCNVGILFNYMHIHFKYKILKIGIYGMLVPFWIFLVNSFWCSPNMCGVFVIGHATGINLWRIWKRTRFSKTGLIPLPFENGSKPILSSNTWSLKPPKHQ